MNKLTSFLLSFIFFCLLNMCCFSQSRLSVLVRQSNAIIRLDSTKIKQREITVIDTGFHSLRVWAPKYQMQTIQKSFVKDSLYKFRISLDYTPEYSNYKRKLLTFHLVRKGTFLLALGSLIYSGITHFDLQKKALDARDRALLEKSQYEKSIIPADLITHKFYYEQYQTLYEDYRHKDNSTLVTSAIVVPVATLVCIYFKIKLKKPVYSESTLLSRIDFQLNSLQYATIKYSF